MTIATLPKKKRQTKRIRVECDVVSRKVDIFVNENVIYTIACVAGLLCRGPIEIDKDKSILRVFVPNKDIVLRRCYKNNIYSFLEQPARPKNPYYSLWDINVNVDELKFIDIEELPDQTTIHPSGRDSDFRKNILKLLKEHIRNKYNMDKEIDNYIKNALKVCNNIIRFGVPDIEKIIIIKRIDQENYIRKICEKHGFNLSYEEAIDLRDYLMAICQQPYHRDPLNSNKAIAVIDGYKIKSFGNELIAFVIPIKPLAYKGVNKSTRRKVFEKQEHVLFAYQLDEYTDHFAPRHKESLQKALDYYAITQCDIKISDETKVEYQLHRSKINSIWDNWQTEIDKKIVLKAELHHLVGRVKSEEMDIPLEDLDIVENLIYIDPILHQKFNSMTGIRDQMLFLLNNNIKNIDDIKCLIEKLYSAFIKLEDDKYDGARIISKYILQECKEWIQ